ncbi:MAG: hypothetical protein IPK35_17285 [Saprospiraceae bacterium]|jgi:hypothetical protein|nr:hypothetical protein [Saprospiraceae bacterium]
MSTTSKSPAVNYIRHIDLFFEIARFSPAINYGHIALYISLFRSWNHSFFSNPMTPARDDIMAYAGIKSKECYYRILREISELDLIRYYPSKSKYETGLFCMSSLELVNEGIKIIVWSISHHQSICVKQLEIPFSDAKPTNGITRPHKSQLINGRGVLFAEKHVLLEVYQTPNPSVNTTYNPLTDPKYASQLDHRISSHSNNSNYANHQNSQSDVPASVLQEYQSIQKLTTQSNFNYDHFSRLLDRIVIDVFHIISAILHDDLRTGIHILQCQGLACFHP